MHVLGIWATELELFCRESLSGLPCWVRLERSVLPSVGTMLFDFNVLIWQVAITSVRQGCYVRVNFLEAQRRY